MTARCTSADSSTASSTTADGTTRTFDVLRTRRVKTIEGVPIQTRQADRVLAAAPACDVLHLVLGAAATSTCSASWWTSTGSCSNIVAQSGAGNLLGNLLCAVAGLLDGGLGGLLDDITNLLNRILARLGLGL